MRLPLALVPPGLPLWFDKPHDECTHFKISHNSFFHVCWTLCDMYVENCVTCMWDIVICMWDIVWHVCGTLCDMYVGHCDMYIWHCDVYVGHCDMYIGHCDMFMQALNDAKRELRFLLVYLHSDEHQDTEQFCRYACPKHVLHLLIIILTCQCLVLRPHLEHLPTLPAPVEHRHRQDSTIQTCPGRALSIHSRFYSPLPSLFLTFSSKFLWLISVCSERFHVEVVRECSTFSVHVPTICISS